MSDVPEGYKMSEVGVIPEGWEVKTLGDCLLRNPEYGINAPAVPYSDNLPTYIRITDISEEGRFLPEKKSSVSNINSNNYFLEKDDIVFARTGASTGKTYLYNSNDGDLVFAGFLIRVKVNPSELIAQYLKSYTETGAYWNWVQIMSMRSGQPGINGNEYAQLRISLPPLPEQQAIASALSDVDALITALEQLITKKRNIKQGAMQQLLTGEKRLPGFGGEWDINTLKNLSDYITVGFVGSMSHLFTTGGVPLLRGTNIQPGYLNLSELKYISNQTHSLWKKSSLEPGDIIVVRVGYPGTATVVPEGVGALNSASLVIIRPKKDKVNSNYICYVLNSNWGKREIQNQLVGGAQQVFNIKTASEFKISIPPTKEEQTAIATILSDMDAEIESLEQKRDKYTMLKQGMMQELLTGKTRLV